MVIGPTCGMVLADMAAENFKPGTLVKYGLDYVSLSANNPRSKVKTPKSFCMTWV